VQLIICIENERSPTERSRDIVENGRSSDTPKLVSTPEVVSGHMAAAMRSMTSPLHDVIMAAGPLLFPVPVFRPPLLPLADLANSSYPDFRTLPEVVRSRTGSGVDSESESGSGSGSGNRSADDDCEEAVNDVTSASPLDLSPPRCGLGNNYERHGNL